MIGEGWLDALAKKNNLNSSCLYLTLRCHAIFAKKKVIKVGGLATLTKKDWIHLIYFLSNTPCNFCKKRKIIEVGGLTLLAKKD